MDVGHQPAGIDALRRHGIGRPGWVHRLIADLLRIAYAEVIASGAHVTDETSAVQVAGAPVALVASAEWNGKITFASDLELARLIVRGRAAG